MEDQLMYETNWFTLMILVDYCIEMYEVWQE